MQAAPEPADGLILLNKPEGLTSHDCVAAVRRLCPRKFKVGHGGTLDPFCTGLLILLLGKGTRLASLFQMHPENRRHPPCVEQPCQYS